MAKQVYAVTNINHNGTVYEAGSVLDTELFSKDELRALYDIGSVEIRENVEEEKVVQTDPGNLVVEKPKEAEITEPKKVTKGPDTSVKAP